MLVFPPFFASFPYPPICSGVLPRKNVGRVLCSIIINLVHQKSMQFQHQRISFNEPLVHCTLFFGKLFSAADSVSNEAQLDDGCKAGSCMATPLLAGELQIGKQVEALSQCTFSFPVSQCTISLPVSQCTFYSYRHFVPTKN